MQLFEDMKVIASSVIIDNIAESPINIGSSEYVEVFSKSENKIIIHEFILELNSDSMMLQIEVDGVIMATLNLNECKTNLKLTQNTVNKFTILSPNPLIWIYQPPISHYVNQSFKIKLKSLFGTKRIDRGLVVWSKI